MVAATDDQKQTFLDALARTGVVADACREANIHYVTQRAWRQNDEDFAKAYDDALEMAGDALESVARRRAIEGVERKRYNKDGNLISEEVVYSDSLMALLLKANKPDKFADRTKSEISSPDGSLKPTNDTEAAARLVALIDEAKRRRAAQGEEDDLFS